MSSTHTNPSAEPHRIMSSAARVLTEVSSPFMRRHRMDDFDDLPEKKNTQQEQDTEDEKARKRAMRNLANSWQERLQLISVITTFFASTEAAMLVNTKPGSADEWGNIVLQVSNASLLGALIVHVYASVLSFLGAFLIISYKLREDTREEMIVEGIPVSNSPLSGRVIRDVERAIDPQRVPASNANGSYPVEPPIFSAKPHVELVGLFGSHASSHRVLSRTHGLCVFLAGVGFILSLVGILCYSWALQPIAVSIFASVCLGGALLSMFALRI